MGQEEALAIKNKDILHCSVLAEDAIKAAIGDWNEEEGRQDPQRTYCNPARCDRILQNWGEAIPGG